MSPLRKRGHRGVLKKLIQTCPRENGEKKFLQDTTITEVPLFNQFISRQAETCDQNQLLLHFTSAVLSTLPVEVFGKLFRNSKDSGIIYFVRYLAQYF